MPGFDPNILKPEEELSGFGLSEPDGDIFSLKEDYPQEVPQFQNEPEPLIDETPVEEFVDEAPGLDVDAEGISQAPLIETPESGSVWDAFEDDPPTSQAETEAEEPTSTEEVIPQEIENVEEATQETEDTVEEDVSAFAEDEEDPEEINFQTEEEEVVAEEPTPEPEVTEEVDTFDDSEDDVTDTVEETDFSLSLGDDLKQMLEEELNRSKARKEEAQKENQNEEPIEKSDPAEFQPVEKIADTEFIDITEIDREEKEARALKEQEAKGSQEKVGEDQKTKKKSGLLRIIGISAAAVVMLAALGIGVFQYWYYPNFMVEQPLIAEKATEEKHEEAAPEKETGHKENEEAHHAETKHEKAKPEEHDNHQAIDVSENTDEHPAEEQKSEEVAPVQVEHIETDKKEESHKEEHKEPVKATPKPKEETKPVDVTSKHKEKVIATQTSNSRTNKKPDKIKESPIKVEEKKESDELFAVQIYASPSKDDAEAWLDNLKDMEVDNPRISTQKIRDVIWYRVRFGNFKSKDDARNAAMRYGFAQTWIDRIK